MTFNVHMGSPPLGDINVHMGPPPLGDTDAHTGPPPLGTLTPTQGRRSMLSLWAQLPSEAPTGPPPHIVPLGSPGCHPSQPWPPPLGATRSPSSPHPRLPPGRPQEAPLPLPSLPALPPLDVASPRTPPPLSPPDLHFGGSPPLPPRTHLCPPCRPRAAATLLPSPFPARCPPRATGHVGG